MPIRLLAPPIVLAPLIASDEALNARGLVVLSVARSSRRRARLIARALHTRLPDAQVILAALAGPRPESPASNLRGIRYVLNITELLDALGLPLPTPTPNAAPGAPGEGQPRDDSDTPANNRPPTMPAR